MANFLMCDAHNCVLSAECQRHADSGTVPDPENQTYWNRTDLDPVGHRCHEFALVIAPKTENTASARVIETRDDKFDRLIAELENATHLTATLYEEVYGYIFGETYTPECPKSEDDYHYHCTAGMALDFQSNGYHEKLTSYISPFKKSNSGKYEKVNFVVNITHHSLSNATTTSVQVLDGWGLKEIYRAEGNNPSLTVVRAALEAKDAIDIREQLLLQALEKKPAWLAYAETFSKKPTLMQQCELMTRVRMGLQNGDIHKTDLWLPQIDFDKVPVTALISIVQGIGGHSHLLSNYSQFANMVQMAMDKENQS